MVNDKLKNNSPEPQRQECPDEEYEEYEEYEDEPRGPSGFSLALNRYFHHLDRGGTLGGEILAGIGMFFLAICVIFMNMQLAAGAIGYETELVNAPGVQSNIDAAHLYTNLYVGAILVSILGSLLMGIVAKLPFTQVSLAVLGTSLLSLVASKSGLTWQNLLFISLIAGLLYTVVCAVPKLRLWILDGIPAPVRKALPAAFGLMIAWYALKQSGIFALENGAVTGLALSGMRQLKLWGLIGAAVAAALFILMSILKRKHKVFWPLMGGTVVFVGALVILGGTDTSNTESFINFGRIWLIAGSQASPTTPFGDSYLTYAMDSITAVFGNLGQVLTVGTDFSAYTGSTVTTVIGGVLMYALTGLFSTQAVLGSDPVAEEDGKALVCNAAANVLAPFFGVTGVTPGASSAAALRDGAKSGIASVVAAIFFAISLFVMAFPALFATETYGVNGMNQWNYFAYGNGGIVYLMQGAVFTIVDIVLACVGISMTASLKQLDRKAVAEWLSAVVCVLAAVLTMDLVAGVLCGTVVYLIVSAIKDRGAIRLPMIVLTALMAVATVLI